MRRLCCALLVSLVVVLGAPPAAAEAAYSPPVDGPVVDRFRPPVDPYGPGNRGVDYATSPGDPVRAAADGEVVFAGRVGPGRHVVVLHPDGLRTSYSFLADVAVRRGDRVVRGDVVGHAGASLHFGVRTGDDRYLDPEALLAGTAPVVHLVPRRRSVAGERQGLLRSLLGLGVRVVGTGVAWAREAALAPLRVPLGVVRMGWRARLFLAAQRQCTPSSTPPRPRPPGRRIALLVAGFGSASGGGAILDLDTRALGYADADVAQFSYRGGQAPGRRSLEGVPAARYDATDSQGDIRVAAARFRALVTDVRAAHPGVPVDVFAHSQGGLVVRLAAVHVDHVVTLGTPHHGADLAAANRVLGGTAVGRLAQGAIRGVTGGGTDPTSAAASQLAGGSDLLADLPPPDDGFTSIAASGDLVVPALQSGLDGATNAVVRLAGPRAHDALPGSPEAAREVALALAGQGPTCRDVTDDLVLAAAVGVVEGALGIAFDRLPGPDVPVVAAPR